ncbi:hypothetical protein FIBSPDRAFT_945520 [Athelia psychrophila]|uniref:Uncharacterized protein n=1 Tax=Athelia psychrophila TaxID=1759441 RepID=A0A166TVB7_9AGAM|nr:hypothetical protein FIBSPDRAFT_945520 [Fibularhizoctonia sp. CBS 109695]
MKTFFIALVFSTRNQTPFIPSVILERVFVDANIHLVPVGDGQGDAKGEEMTETLDGLELGVNADAALKILRKHTSWKEMRIAGDVKYLLDVNEEHSDAKYTARYYYRLKYKEDEETQKTFKFAEQNFAQMYFIRNYASDKSRVEMSFNLTNCEASVVLPTTPTRGQSSSTSRVDTQDSPPLECHIFRRVFLNKSYSRHIWIKDEIDLG